MKLHLDFGEDSLIVFSGFIGRLVRKKNRDEETDTWEKVKVSNKLDFLKDMSILMSIVMIVVYIFTALMAGTEVVSEFGGRTKYNSICCYSGNDICSGSTRTSSRCQNVSG